MKKYIRWPMWVVLAMLLVAVFVATAPFLHTSQVRKAHASGTATLKFDRTTLTANTLIKVTGTGFNSDDYVHFYIDDPNNPSPNGLQAGSSGDFSSKIWLPTGILQGKHVFFAQDSVNTVQIPVTFKPRIAGVAGKSGLSTQFSGGSFVANETVSIYWGTSSAGTSEGTATANATGDLTFSFNAPSNLASGTYPVTVLRTNQKPTKITTTFKVIPVTMISTPGIRLGQKGITVQLSGFLPNDTVDISWSANGGESLGTLFPDSKGAVSKTTLWPQSSVPLGSYTLTASDSSGLTVTNPLNVGPGINFWANAMVPNQSLYITGGGFTPGETIQAYFANPQNGVVTATTDSTGAFNVTVTTPNTYDPSKTYSIYAKSTTNSEQAHAKYTPEQPQVFAEDVTYNESIGVTGVGFGVGETVNAVWGYQQLGQQTIGNAVADSTGYVSFGLTEPSFPVRNLTIALIGQTSHYSPTITVVNNATVLLNPVNGNAGTSITLSGGNFGANDTLTIAEQGTVVTQVTSQSDGSFTATLIAPPDPNQGDLAITVTDATANVTAGSAFYYPPQVAISPSTVHVGDTITITGQHFVANTGVDLYTPQYGTSRPQHWATTDANGAFTVSFVVTSNEFSSGLNTVYASDNIAVIMVSTTFTIQ